MKDYREWRGEHDIKVAVTDLRSIVTFPRLTLGKVTKAVPVVSDLQTPAPSYLFFSVLFILGLFFIISSIQNGSNILALNDPQLIAAKLITDSQTITKPVRTIWNKIVLLLLY